MLRIQIHHVVESDDGAIIEQLYQVARIPDSLFKKAPAEQEFKPRIELEPNPPQVLYEVDLDNIMSYAADIPDQLPPGSVLIDQIQVTKDHEDGTEDCDFFSLYSFPEHRLGQSAETKYAMYRTHSILGSTWSGRNCYWTDCPELFTVPGGSCFEPGEIISMSFRDKERKKLVTHRLRGPDDIPGAVQYHVLHYNVLH